MNEEKVKEAMRVLKSEVPEKWEDNMYYSCCPSDWELPEKPCIQNCEKCWEAAIT